MAAVVDSGAGMAFADSCRKHPDSRTPRDRLGNTP
jgi:hypothetical protein